LTVSETIAEFQPDIVFACNSPERLIHLCIPPKKRNHKLVLYIKVDDFPISKSVVSALAEAELFVTMSCFSSEALLKSGAILDLSKLKTICCPTDESAAGVMSRFESITAT
jgi:hypothetical protein